MSASDTSYICPKIDTYLKATKGTIWTVEAKRIGSVIVDCCVWIRSDDCPDEEISLPLIGQYVLGLIAWIQTLRWSSRELKRLKVELYLSPHKKVWCPAMTTTIDRCHMNSGETSFYEKEAAAAIKIWRREDYAKVLIHELLHAFDWDRLVPVQVRHNVKTKVHEAEAVVEALANVFQCLLFSKGDPVLFHKNRLIERDHALAIALELSSRTWTTRETHVREYCLLKAALLCTEETFSRFWSWLSSKDERTAQHTWAELRDFCEDELRNVVFMLRQKQTTGKSTCVSLRLVSLSLSLSPSRIFF